MGSTYQTQITAALQALYPTMSSTDTSALAWAGLYSSKAWTDYKSEHPTEALNLLSIAAQYRVNTIGTGCD